MYLNTPLISFHLLLTLSLSFSRHRPWTHWQTRKSVCVCLSAIINTSRLTRGGGGVKGRGVFANWMQTDFITYRMSWGIFCNPPPPLPSFLCPIVSRRPTQDCFLDILFRHKETLWRIRHRHPYYQESHTIIPPTTISSSVLPITLVPQHFQSR